MVHIEQKTRYYLIIIKNKMELSIEKFNPTKAELLKVVKEYEWLEIKDINDIKGYEAVKLAKKDLVSRRNKIKNTGLELRSEANEFRSQVLNLEKDLLEVIQPLEVELKAKQDAIDEERLKIERLESLPERNEKLKEIEVEIPESELLEMNDAQFLEFFIDQKTEYLEKKSQEQKELAEKQQREIQKQQEKLDEQKRLQEAKEQAEIEAKKEAERQRELDKEKFEFEKSEIKRKAEEEKQRILDEAKEKEENRKREEKEKEGQKAREEKEVKEKAEKEAKELADKKARLEKQKKYQKWLKDNGHNPETHVIKDEGDKIVLYLRVSSFAK